MGLVIIFTFHLLSVSLQSHKEKIDKEMKSFLNLGDHVMSTARRIYQEREQETQWKELITSAKDKIYVWTNRVDFVENAAYYLTLNLVCEDDKKQIEDDELLNHVRITNLIISPVLSGIGSEGLQMLITYNGKIFSPAELANTPIMKFGGLDKLIHIIGVRTGIDMYQMIDGEVKGYKVQPDSAIQIDTSNGNEEICFLWVVVTSQAYESIIHGGIYVKTPKNYWEHHPDKSIPHNLFVILNVMENEKQRTECRKHFKSFNPRSDLIHILQLNNVIPEDIRTEIGKNSESAYEKLNIVQ